MVVLLMSYAEDEGYDAYDGSDYLGFVGLKKKPKHERDEQTWIMKNGIQLLVKNMDDKHLFNAYMMSGADYLFKEMVYRSFERLII